MEFKLSTEIIKLDQLLKAAGIVQSGGEAHSLIEMGKIKVDNVVCTVKRKQLRVGQKVSSSQVEIFLT